MANTGKGLNRTTGRTERHQHQSWGRTRQPKNIAGAHGTQVGVIAHNSTPNDDLDDTTAAENGYFTENQRHMLITVKPVGGGPGKNLEVYVYQHAVGFWVLHSTQTITAITVPTQYQLDIYGVDKVAFKVAGTAAAFTNVPQVYASCSTF